MAVGHWVIMSVGSLVGWEIQTSNLLHHNRLAGTQENRQETCFVQSLIKRVCNIAVQ